MTASEVRIVLVRPREEKNVGSVCRAMKTMGFGNLYIVGCDPIEHDQAAVTAVHAADILERAVYRETLREAVKDSVLVAGVSRRRGKWRKYFAVTPEQLAGRIASIRGGTCSIVFGNEATGLNAGDLRECHIAVRIPSAPEFPSLNLSHAVQIITYQLYARLRGSGSPGGYAPIAGGALDSLVSLMIAALANIGFFTQGDPGEMSVFLRDIFARAALEQREADRLAGVFEKISGLIAHRAVENKGNDGMGIKP